MSRTARRSLATLAAAASLQALLLSGSALAQGVRIFEEAPPLDVLRNIMIPESRPDGLSRRIVITNPDRPASSVLPAAAAAAVGYERAPEAAAPAPVRRPRPVVEPGPVMASARAPAPAPVAAPPVVQAAMPAPKPQEAAASAGIVGFRINFALNSDVVPQNAYAFVDRIAELMREQPQVKLQVEGHTDATGSDEYNLLLSMRRVAAVANYLVQQQGIPSSRLVVMGKGEAEPLAANPFDGGNRRVQFLRVE